MVEVKFGEYRKYLQQRIDCNDSIMALLVGSQLARNALQLNTGSAVRLGDIYPRIKYVTRLNVRSDSAALILEQAERNLGYMAFPYILSIHEDLQRTFLKLVTEAGFLSRQKANGASSSMMHELFEESTGISLSVDSLALYHIVRLLRNRIIHDAGVSNIQVEKALSNLSPSQIAGWEKISGRSLPDATAGKRIDIGHDEIVVALAVTKQLARDLNVASQAFYPRNLWLDRLIVDVVEEGVLRGNPEQRIKKVVGFARTYYTPIAVTAQEAKHLLAKQ